MPAKRARPGGDKGSRASTGRKRAYDDMSSSRDALTYRVRRIPHEYTTLESLAIFLSGLEPRLGASSNIEVYSLASSLDPYDETKIATVMFKETPELLADGKDEWVIQFRSGDGTRSYLVIDLHFRDFTVLNDPLEGEEHVDCFAVSGLASHAFGSWRCRSVSAYMWLRDQLPRDTKNVRVILYGYDSRLFQSESFQTLADIAATFKTALCDARGRSVNLPPTVFVAHSLGGLVVKHALMQLAADTGAGPLVAEVVRSILFLGTPNKGMDTDHLQAMVKGQANEQLVQQLAVGSSTLEALEDRFKGISLLCAIRKVSFYETLRSPTANINSDGKWSLTGPHAILVSRDSAIQDDSSQQDQHPVNRTHSNLAKFDPDDPCYRVVRNHISDICHSLPEQGSYAHHLQDITPRAPFASSSRSIVSSTTRRRPVNSLPEQALGNVLSKRDIRKLVASIKERFMSDEIWTNIHPSFASIDYFVTNFTTDSPRSAPTRTDAYDLADAIWKSYRKELRFQMLQSLQFEEQHARLHQITEAAPFTFEWAFSNPRLGLKNWLLADQDLYWIRGKPGSGKSTLLKYILTHRNTEALVMRSSKTRSLLLSYFFHDRGSQSQKSLEGLVQSLVSQILDMVPELEDIIISIFVQVGGPSGQIWALDSGRKMLDAILTQNVLDLNIICFLDALDEFCGDKSVLCSFIFELTKMAQGGRTQFRICFTSRPEPVLLDEFRSVPGFAIHEYTHDDITSFLHFKLKKAKDISSLLYPVENNPLEKRSIIEEIKRRARGVFLWVSLTIEELSRAITDGATPEQLDHILSSIPDELGDFYQLILARISRRYRRELFCMLDIATRQEQCPTLIFDVAVRVALAKSVDKSKFIMEQYEDARNIPALFDSFQRRLHSRTGGLLEITSPEGSLGSLEVSATHASHHFFQRFRKSRVSFLHQTVKEYFTSGQVLSNVLLGQDMILEGNGHTFLSKTIFLALQAFRLGDLEAVAPNTNFVSLFLLHAHQSEQSTGLHQASFYSSFENQKCIDKLESLLHINQIPVSECTMIGATHGSRLPQLQAEIAIVAGLELLLSHATHFAPPTGVTRAKQSVPRARHVGECQRLLQLVMMCEASASKYDEGFIPLNVKNMIGILMKHTNGDAGRGAWKSAISSALKTHHEYEIAELQPDERSRALLNIETMLLCGQDPNTILWLDATALTLCKQLTGQKARSLERILLDYGAIDQSTCFNRLPAAVYNEDGSRLIRYLQETDRKATKGKSEL